MGVWEKARLENAPVRASRTPTELGEFEDVSSPGTLSIGGSSRSADIAAPWVCGAIGNGRRSAGTGRVQHRNHRPTRLICFQLCPPDVGGDGSFSIGRIPHAR